MPDISAACVTSSYYSVTAALFPPGSNPITGSAIYHVTSPGAKVHGSHYGGVYISPVTFTGTVLTLPDLYRAAVINSATVFAGTVHYPGYIPPGL